MRSNGGAAKGAVQVSKKGLAVMGDPDGVRSGLYIEQVRARRPFLRRDISEAKPGIRRHDLSELEARYCAGPAYPLSGSRRRDWPRCGPNRYAGLTSTYQS